MPFIPSFTKSQPVGNPSAIIFVDTSSGSDANITERHIYLRKADGLFLVPEGSDTDYIVWPLASTTFQIDDILDKDRALQITVEWNSSSTHIIFDNTFDNTFN